MPVNTTIAIGNQTGSNNRRVVGSGGERAAVQTLRAVCECVAGAERLDCGGFSTALAGPKQ